MSAAAKSTDVALDGLTGLGDERQLLHDMTGEVHLTLFDLEGFKHYNDSYGRACGDVMLRRLGRRLADAVGPDAQAYRTRGDEFAVLYHGPAGGAEAVVARGAAALVELGEGFMIRAWQGSVALPAETALPGEALKLADQRLQAHRHDPRADATPELASRESQRTAFVAPTYAAGTLAEQIGERMGFTGTELEDLVAAAELRNVGMMAVPDSIVQGAGGLDRDDRRLIRLNTLVAERLLSANFGMNSVASVVRSSHEQVDGRGYPDGLAGEEIPLAARIVFAAGVFCDLTMDRPYRAAIGVDEALAEIRRNAGRQFDAAVVAVLVEVVGAAGPAAGPFGRRPAVAA